MQENWLLWLLLLLLWLLQFTLMGFNFHIREPRMDGSLVQRGGDFLVVGDKLVQFFLPMAHYVWFEHFSLYPDMDYEIGYHGCSYRPSNRSCLKMSHTMPLSR